MIDNYMLYKNLPSLDLHGEDRFGALVKLEEFINDNIKLKNNLITIIHGKGAFVLRENIHKYIRTNNKVKAFKTDIFNPGVTIIELNIN